MSYKNKDVQKAKAREYYLKNREVLLSKYSAQKDHKNELSRKWRSNMRLDIISHYSDGKMCCNCCGENIYEFLTIDHINNNGSQERKRTGSGGHHAYRLIIKENYPEGFQVLCYNCNCARAKTADKRCPHEKKS